MVRSGADDSSSDNYAVDMLLLLQLSCSSAVTKTLCASTCGCRYQRLISDMELLLSICQKYLFERNAEVDLADMSRDENSQRRIVVVTSSAW